MFQAVLLVLACLAYVNAQSVADLVCPYGIPAPCMTVVSAALLV
jgi:hypothetical protein